jgi:hypothetical protein
MTALARNEYCIVAVLSRNFPTLAAASASTPNAEQRAYFFSSKSWRNSP